MSTRELIDELVALEADRAIATCVGDDWQSPEPRPQREQIVLRQLEIIQALRMRKARVRQPLGSPSARASGRGA